MSSVLINHCLRKTLHNFSIKLSATLRIFTNFESSQNCCFLFKNVNPSKPINYRPLSLFTAIGKLSKIYRLKKFVPFWAETTYFQTINLGFECLLVLDSALILIRIIRRIFSINLGFCLLYLILNLASF